MKEAGEKEFLLLLERHIGILFKIVRIYACNDVDRKELMSDMVFELWRSYPRFRGEAKISTWLYRVALNTALKKKRKRDNNKLVFVEDLLTLEKGSLSETVDRKNEIDLLYACIEKLTPVNKAVVLLYLENKSHKEIAEITGFSQTNVSTRLNRIKEELKTCFEKNEHHGNR